MRLSWECGHQNELKLIAQSRVIAFVQLNQLDDALDYYEQAAKMRDNDYTSPMYLYKAGTIALDLYFSLRKYIKQSNKTDTPLM